MNNPVTQEELIEIAARMAQELCDVMCDAVAAGCKDPMPETQALVDEWEAIYRRTDGHWLNTVNEEDSEPESNLLLNDL
jgi:hypothetical protein